MSTPPPDFNATPARVAPGAPYAKQTDRLTPVIVLTTIQTG